MTFTGREKFITQALTETSTLFERVVIMDIGRIKKDILVDTLRTVVITRFIEYSKAPKQAFPTP
jgi:hypothetical protein